MRTSHAIKVRKHLLKQLEKVQTDGSGGIDHAQFEKVDSLLEAMRLACVQTIFIDFEYATEEKTENIVCTHANRMASRRLSTFSNCAWSMPPDPSV